MEEQNQDSKLDKYTQDRVDKGIKELEEEKELKIKWRKEIDENEELQRYFSNYRPTSIESFINQYLNEKYNAYRYGDMYMQIAQEERTKWIDMAHEHLGYILQKQLFDLQCLWRANEIKLIGVEKCFDFVNWSENILNCPFLKPITESDIKMYQDFLMKCNLEFSNYSMDEEWQEYDDIKESYLSDEEEASIPEWYEHHYTHTGTTNLLLLPNIRGEKEEFYRSLWFKNKQKISEEKKIEAKRNNDPIPLIDSRPYISSFDKEVKKYIFDNFEEEQIRLQYKYYSEGVQEGIDNSFYEEIFRELSEIKEFVPIEKNHDIKEGVHKAYNSYMARKLAEHLPMAHDQYLFNRKMGLVVESNKEYFSDADEVYTRSILDGRELNGEPRDFNF